MQEKQAVITGATSGIGYETAKGLAGMGVAVSIIARNEQKGRDTAEKIKKDTGNAAIDFFIADLSSQKQLQHAAHEILQRHPVIDILVNNAGTWYSDFGLTEDHVERMFAVNHLAYFLLTHYLLPGLKSSPSARVINVASDSHFKGEIHFEDINLTNRYHGLRAYGQSKLANVLFTYEFVRRNPRLAITMNAVQPGLVKTNIGTKHTNPFHALAWRLRRSAGVLPAEGAKTSIYLAASEEVEGLTGKYWDQCKEKPSSKISYDPETASRLWEYCEKMGGVEKYWSPAPPAGGKP